jgi:hypothetical protein
MNTVVKPASAKQLRYLRALAQKTGTTFAPPRSSTDASREITRMRSLKPCPVAPAERDQAEGRFGTAPDDEPAEPAETASPPAPKAPENGAPHDPRRSPSRVTATVIANHEENGTARQVIVISSGADRLLIDRPLAGGATRLLARLTPDEPSSNERLIARLYLADPQRNRCRTLTRADLEPAKPGPPAQAGVAWQTPLIAGIGATFQIQREDAERPSRLRWTELDASTNNRRTVVLRHVVATLESYQPPLAITAAAIAAHRDDPDCSTVALRNELDRLINSRIVLNRGLREHVQRTVKHKQQTMSEIAMRCGRLRTDKRGGNTGETSWLARRIGVLPEAGQRRPTPWVHTDVLALIARDGLGINPCEVELTSAA